MKRICVICEWFGNHDADAQEGDCLRYPPVVLKEDGYVDCEVPSVLETHRCGEWTKRKKEEE